MSANGGTRVWNTPTVITLILRILAVIAFCVVAYDTGGPARLEAAGLALLTASFIW